MATITKYGDISPRTAAYASAEMLKRAQPYLGLQQFGQVKPIPANSTQTVKFRRYTALPLATTALTEGVTPNGTQLASEDVEINLAQYGDFVTLTDVIADTHEDPVFREAQTLIGEQAAQTIETLLYNVLKGGTTDYLAGGVATRNLIATTVTENDLRACIRHLKRQNTMFITQKISSSTSFNTEAVPPSFIAFVHPDLEPALRALQGFKDVVDYGSTTPYQFEIGSFECIRFIQSTVITPFAAAGAAVGATGMESAGGANIDVYPMLIFGKDAFAITPLKGKNALTPMVLNPGTPREGDPLGQRGYIGWKTWFAAGILNDDWMIRYECAAPGFVEPA